MFTSDVTWVIYYVTDCWSVKLTSVQNYFCVVSSPCLEFSSCKQIPKYESKVFHYDKNIENKLDSFYPYALAW